MKTYSTFLFDLDGTLITTRELIIACFKFSLGTLGLSYTEAELGRHIGLPLQEQFKHFIAMEASISVHPPWRAGFLRGYEVLLGWVKYCLNSLRWTTYPLTSKLILTPQDLQLLAKRHMDYQKIIWREYVHTFAEVKATLTKLKAAGKQVGIVTSRYKETTTLYMEAVEIADFFEVVITPEDTVLHKPHGEPILKALEELEELGLLKKPTTDKTPQLTETLYIGDALSDSRAADAAGVDFYYVDWETPSNSKEEPVSQSLANSPDLKAAYKEHDFKKLLTLMK